MGIKVLVCGGRKYDNARNVIDFLNRLNKFLAIESVAQGEAKGADQFAKRWAESRQVECKKYPANWQRYGKGAGSIRNRAMLDDYRPDVVVAFPGGTGTQNMIDYAFAKECPVLIVDDAGQYVTLSRPAHVFFGL